MYPTLYHLVNDIFGIEISGLRAVQSFGFFVAMAFLTASYFFQKELKRKEDQGLIGMISQKVYKGGKASTKDLILSGLLGFVLGFKLLHLILNSSEFLENTQKFLLSTKGNLLGGIIGAALVAYMKYREKEKEKLPEPKWIEEPLHPYELVGNMTLVAAVAGILGAKIFHNLENLEEFMSDPWGSLISFSGLTMYGGLIVGSTAVIGYAVKNKINAWHLIDACAPGLMLAYGVGRIGCQIAGDGDWGIDNPDAIPQAISFLPDWMWSYSFPHNVNNVGVPIPGCKGDHCNMLPVPVFPTPFYETVMCSILFFLLWSIRKKVSTPGVLFCIYLACNGVERFLIELIRVNTVYHIFGNEITQAQIISSMLIITGVVGVFYLRRRNSTINPQ